MDKRFREMAEKIRDISHDLPDCTNRYVPRTGLKRSDVLLENGVRACGLGENRGDYRWGRANPHMHHLLFTRSGAGVVRDNENRFIVRKGDLAILPARHPYLYYIAKEPWEHFYFHFTPKIWPMLDGNRIIVRKSLFWPELEQLLVLYYNEACRGMEDSGETLGFVGEAILQYLRREVKSAATPGESEMQARYSRLIRRINSDPGHCWTLKEMASDFCLSPGRFVNVTRKLLKQTPMELVTRSRMQKAAVLLGRTNGKLSNVAAKVGYGNYYAFSTAFKRFYGDSPREFQKLLRLVPTDTGVRNGHAVL
jgi:AraC family transcriptional regulator, arabinose operon regulatory protein